MKTSKKTFSSFLPLLVLALAIVVFFSPHLFPPKVFVAGDYGGSDFSDLFWPLKSLLTTSLRSGKLPLWSDQLGAGFPIIGEGEIQLFSPTTLLFIFLPLPLAFQITVISSFLLIGLGVYFLGQTLKIGQTSSLFAALAFMLSAPFVLGLEHLSIITTAVGLPWAWLVTFRWAEKFGQKKLTFVPEGLFLAIILVWQFFQAAPQITFLTIFSSSWLFLAMIWPKPQSPNQILNSHQLNQVSKPIIYLALAVLLGATIAAIQILPSWEMRQHSNRAEPYQLEQMGQFSLSSKRLVNLIIPFALSNPSHPPAYFSFGEGPLLWETNGYAGLLTFFMGIIGLIVCRDRKGKVLAWLLLVSLLLAFGPHTPAKIVLRLFPFSAFRVPGRFLIIVDLSLALLAAFFLDQKLLPTIKKVASPKIFLLIGPLLILTQSADLFYYGASYNASVRAEKIFKDPFTAQVIKKEDERYYSLAGWYVYNTIYLQEKGWRGRGEAYVPFHSTLFPNINLMYQVPGISSYAGMKVKRSDYFDAILQGYFQINTDELRALVKPRSLEAIMSIGATRYLISPFRLNLPYPAVAETAEPYPHLSLFVYRLPYPKPRAWFTNLVKTISSESHLQQILTAGVLGQPEKLRNLTYVEKPLDQIFASIQNSTDTSCPNGQEKQSHRQEGQTGSIPANILKSTDQELTLQVKTPRCGLLVLADTYYPGWEARINGQPAPIYRANYNFRAVAVPPGDHRLSFVYRPRSFYNGGLISAAGLVILLGLLGKRRLDRSQKQFSKTDLPKG